MFPVFVHNHAADSRFSHQLANPPDLAGNQWGQAFGGFVEDQHIRVGHQGPAYGEHLLLAARQLLAAVAQAFLQARKGLQHPLVCPIALTPGPGTGCHFEVLDHAEVAEDATSLRHISNAEPGNFVGSAAQHGFADDVDAARTRRDQPHDAFEKGAFAHAVAAHETDGFTARHRKIDTTQDVAGTIVGVQVFGIDDQTIHRIPNRPPCRAATSKASPSKGHSVTRSEKRGGNIIRPDKPPAPRRRHEWPLVCHWRSPVH